MFNKKSRKNVISNKKTSKIMKNRTAPIFAFICLMLITACATTKKMSYAKDKDLLTAIDQNFKDAGEQYKLLMKNLPADKFPKTYFPQTGKYEFSNSKWWCSGFYAGSLLYIYEQTKDPVLQAETERNLKVLEKDSFF